MRCVSLGLMVALVVPTATAGVAVKDVAHPFLLWTKAEAAALRKRIEADPLAKKQYELMQTSPRNGNPTMLNLFKCLVMGDQSAGDRERKALLGFIGTKPVPMTWDVDPRTLKWNKGMPSYGDRHMRDEQTLHTLRYDVLYDRLTDAQRAGVEKAMRDYIAFHLDGHKPWHPDFRYDRTSWLPNMHWPRAIGTHLMAVAMKDRKLIEAMFRSQGGWKWFFDEYIADGRFYMEEFGKYYSNIGTMLTYCEGLERLGLGQYGYGYTGAGGATMRKYLEMPIWIGLPRQECAAGGMPHYPAVAMGDAGELELVRGHAPPRAGGKSSGGNRWWSTAHMNGPLPKMQLPMWFEAGHRRWPDAGFDYFLAQLRGPGEKLYLPTLYYGLGPIDPEEVSPPPAPSYVSRQRGFALLRANESPGYWESDAPAVAQQFGMYYVHYVHDCFAMLGYYAKGRCIYKRMGRPKGRRGYAGGDPWKDHVRGHCGVVVDGLKAKPVDNGNNGCANQRIRERLVPKVKFCAAQAAGIYPDVRLERALFLTREYLLGVFALSSPKPRVYDWQVLAFGEAVGVAGWQALEAIGDDATRKRFTKPHLSATKVTLPDAKPWSVVVMQDDVAAPRGVGVRLSMLAEKGTGVLVATPPGVDEGKGTAVMATRTKPTTVFAALHEPFEGGQAKAPTTTFERIEQNECGLAVRIVGTGVDDRVLFRYGEGVDLPVTLTGGEESFTFADHVWLRISGQSVEAYGDLRAMRLRVAGAPRLSLNGRATPAKVQGGFLAFSAE